MGYSTKQLSISTADKRQRIINRKHTKLTYDERLVKSKNCTGIRAELAQSDSEKDKEKLKHQRGRKSFEEIAIEQDLFNDITDAITDFVIMNPFYSPREIMEFLKSEFKSVFSKSTTKYPQNFWKCIEAVDEWREALKVYEKDIDTQRAVLRNLHKRAVKGLREEIGKQGKIYEVGMTDKDAMQYIRLLHDMKQWEKEDQAVDTDSAETKKTLLNIDRNCSSDEADEDEDGD